MTNHVWTGPMIDTKYEDGFKAGVRHGWEEIERTTYERLSEDERREIDAEAEAEELQDEFEQNYPLQLAAIYKSWELESDQYQVLKLDQFKHLVIKPEPVDPQRRTYDAGFVDGLCCILVANSDVLSGDANAGLDAWKNPGWHEAFERAVSRAGYASNTDYSTDWFRLVKVS
jgi:hypothetical protein